MRGTEFSPLESICHGIATRWRVYPARLGDDTTLATGVWQFAGQPRTSPTMKRSTTSLPNRDLGDPLWTAEHIATYLGMRLAAAYTRIAEPGFPNPVGHARRHRRWLSEHVVEYFSVHTTATPTFPASTHFLPSPTLPGHTPTATFRKRRTAAA